MLAWRSSRRGTTLLETLLTVTIAAGAIVLATTFALNGLSTTNELHSQQDFNTAFRRIQGSFLRDVSQTTRFHFGYTDNTKVSTRSITPLEDPQDLILGYTNERGQDIWVHYTAKASASTGSFYLLKTSNEQDGETYLTTILAPEVEGVTFRFYDARGNRAGLASEIRRIEMDLSLASANVKRQNLFTGVLRAGNEGTVRLPPGLEFDAIEDANFLR